MASEVNLTQRFATWGFWTGLGIGGIISALGLVSGAAGGVMELVSIPLGLAIFFALCGGSIGITVTIALLLWTGILNFLQWLSDGESETESQPTQLTNEDIQDEDIAPALRRVLPRGRMRVAHSIEDLPVQAGIYRHINRADNLIQYIGQTNNIRRRSREHVNAGKLDFSTQKVAYAVIPDGVDLPFLQEWEKRHIGKHKPPGNKHPGGNGRPPRPGI